MNEHLFKNLKNAPEYSLSEAERTRMRAELAELSRTSVTTHLPTPSPWFVYLMRPMPLAAFALILTISTTSVSFAAGGALPGDVLYPVKVRVNEGVELALSPGVEAKANVRVRHAEERLRETELLAVEGALTEEVAVNAAVEVARNVEAAVEAAVSLREEGDDSAAENVNGRIASALLAHAELLEAHAENFDEKPRETLRTLARAASDAAYQAEVDFDGEEEDVDEARVQIAAEAAEHRAKDRLRDLGERIEKNGIVDETELAFTDEYLRLTSDFDATAEYLDTEDFRNAAKTYGDIDRRAYRALTFLTSAQRIGDTTDKEVVVVLETEAPEVANAAPIALRAKTAAEPEAATMSLMMEATTAEDVATTSDAFEDASYEAIEDMIPQRSDRLQFWLRDRVKD